MPATLIYIGREDTIRPHLYQLAEDLMLLDDLAHARDDLGGRRPDPVTDGEGPFLIAYGPTALAAAGAYGRPGLGVPPAWGRAVALMPDPDGTATRVTAPAEVWRGVVLLECHHAITIPRGLRWLHALLVSARGGVR